MKMREEVRVQMILAKGLVKRFGDVTAINGLTLHIGKGIFGIIGPNGSGKTTFIKILMGLLRQDSGECQVFGMDCWKNSLEIKKKVGVLHEKPAYPKNLTLIKFLEYVARLKEIPASLEAGREALDAVGLSDVAYKTIGTLSAGMLQRLGLAQALIGMPELVILDEPTSNLDVIGRIKLLSKIKEIHQEKGVSFLISSHSLPEIEKVCSHIAVMRYGILLEEGAVEELLSKYSKGVYRVVTSNPQLMAEKVSKLEYVELVKVNGASFNIKLRGGSENELFTDVGMIAQELNEKLISIYPIRTLEEAFKIIMGIE